MRRSLMRAACGLALLTLAVPAAAGDALYLWRVQGEHATLGMTGSVHVGKPEFFPLAAPIEEAFAAADALAVEVDMFAPENVQAAARIMMQDGMLPGDETLETRLGPELWQRLVAYAEERGFPLAMYAKLKPGLVAMMLVMNEYQRQGYDPELGIDKHFLDAARETGKPIRELETLEDQFDLFLQVNDRLDDLLVDEMLDQMDDVRTITDRMIALWQAGDAEGMDEFMQEQTGDEPEMVEFYRALLDDRNVAMADSLDAWLRGDADIFVVVGAGHFGGEKGLIRLLEDKGWDVEQVAR
jgi:uncharacterized protein YbaP (TraB family)